MASYLGADCILDVVRKMQLATNSNIMVPIRSQILKLWDVVRGEWDLSHNRRIYARVVLDPGHIFAIWGDFPMRVGKSGDRI